MSLATQGLDMGTLSKIKLFGLLAGISIYALAVQPAAAVSITLNASGSGTDGPLSASAAFTTSSGLLSVTITDTLTASLIRSGVAESKARVTNSLADRPARLEPRVPRVNWRNIGDAGTVTNVSGLPLRWLWQGPRPPGGQGTFNIEGNTVTMEALGGGQPSQLLLPSSSSFTNANSSITGGQFNPFVVGPETFTLNLSGVTARPETFITVPSPIAGAGLPGLVAACGALLALARRRRRLVA